MLRFASILMLLLGLAPAQATEAGWALLREGGHVVLLRHAITPGSGEPANFDVEKCSTQRNLTDRGRQQARKMSALFLARADATERVLSSRYCNSLETARTVFGDRIVEPFAPLDRLSDDEAAAKAQNEAVMQEIRGYSGSGNFVLVTHLENIMALTGNAAREGEALIVRPEGDGLHILGRIVFN
jgi:phosphohistidine phosphatase SixA